MPSALESLVKILKLERDKGYDNSAVIGGLKAYAQNWRGKAHQQARIPEHHILVDELVDLLANYETVNDLEQRHNTVSYMLDRITGRVQPPEKYTARLDQYQDTKPPSRKDRRQKHEDRRQKRDKVREKRSRSKQPEQDTYTPELDIPPQPRLARPPRHPRRRVDAQEARDILNGLEAPVERMKGVGPRLAKSLQKLGLNTINDLLFYLPRRYDDYSQLLYVAQLKPGMTATVIGVVSEQTVRPGRNNRKDLYIELDDGSAILPVTFFGQHYLSKAIRKGKQIVINGKVTVFRGRIQMSNPEWEELDRDNLRAVGIVPVYGLTDGLSARRMRSLMRETVTYWTERIVDYVPEVVLERTELADLGWALQHLHFPAGQDHLGHARRRYVFDQLLLLQLAILANRREWQSVPGVPLNADDDFIDGFLSAVYPYPLTGAQRRAVNDIRADIAKDIPMNRLLQGDVGSGKTAVAVTAMAMAYANGKQAALMAPTGILAEQHYRGISNTLQSYPGDDKPVIALLTGALTASERETIYAGLADGSIDMVIGTHALIQEGVEFSDLALAIIDEQHRFGVEQRGLLRGKGHNPHLLIMTATPIPRTMALTIYADLDLSIMDEMPPGRTPVDTRIVLPSERERIYRFIESEISKGRQVFIVHPLVEASEKIEAQSAVEAFDRLSKVFHRQRVCLLHGKMKPTEKDDIMAAFAEHEYDIMVTTSVAEVGVDVPNASVIVIEGANRFGLAQLHQFRGRVGRGGYQSFCLLIPDDITSETAAQLSKIQSMDDVLNPAYGLSVRRLRAMELTTDGFKLADVDWRLRGAGDLIGTRQSGRSQIQIAEIMTPDLVSMAQQEARTLYTEDPYLEQDEHALLNHRVAMLYDEDSDLS